MPFTRAAFNPTDGIKNISTYPTNPSDETAARKQIQDNLDQMKDAINTLETELEASGAAGKLGCTGGYANIQEFITAVIAAGSGNVPPANTITDAMMTSDVKIGSLAALTTSIKTSIVNAINSVVTSIGALAGLSTTEKGSVVGAINEVNTKATSKLSTQGDILIRGSSTDERLAIGLAYQSLNVNSAGTLPQYQASLQSLMTAAGDIVYASGANTPARLAKGTDGQILGLSSGLPAWEAKLTYATATGSDSSTAIPSGVFTKTIPLGISAKIAFLTLYAQSGVTPFVSIIVGSNGFQIMHGTSSSANYASATSYPSNFSQQNSSNPFAGSTTINTVSISGTDLVLSFNNASGSTFANFGWRIVAFS